MTGGAVAPLGPAAGAGLQERQALHDRRVDAGWCNYPGCIILSGQESEGQPCEDRRIRRHQGHHGNLPSCRDGSAHGAGSLKETHTSHAPGSKKVQRGPYSVGLDGSRPSGYEFGPFRIDTHERLLRRGETIVPLTPKAIETLLVLIEGQGQLVSKESLMDRLWPGTFVEEANLSNQISLLRRTLGDSAADRAVYRNRTETRLPVHRGYGRSAVRPRGPGPRRGSPPDQALVAGSGGGARGPHAHRRRRSVCADARGGVGQRLAEHFEAHQHRPGSARGHLAGRHAGRLLYAGGGWTKSVGARRGIQPRGRARPDGPRQLWRDDILARRRLLLLRRARAGSPARGCPL